MDSGGRSERVANLLCATYCQAFGIKYIVLPVMLKRLYYIITLVFALHAFLQNIFTFLLSKHIFRAVIKNLLPVYFFAMII